jgi:hypothetical protein
MGRTNKIDIETKTRGNEILRILNSENTLIPLQSKFENKVRITTNAASLTLGFQQVLMGKDTIQTLAFNYPKEESFMNFMDLNELKKISQKGIVSGSISDVFKKINKKNQVHWLWKWFLTLAIVSLLLEILILKFYKP